MSRATRGGARQRGALLTGAVDHVLRHGVATLSLRPLAAALGTSDRMLLYYFHTRDQLLAEVLGTVGSRLRTALEQALPPEPMAPPALLARVWSLVQSEDVEPYVRLYVEVCGLAARRHEPYRTVAMEVADEWRTWMAPRLAVPAAERASATAGLLTLLDGLLVVRFATGADAARAAEGWLLTHLD